MSLKCGQGPHLNGGSGLLLAQCLYVSSPKTESILPLMLASARDLRNLDVPQSTSWLHTYVWHSQATRLHSTLTRPQVVSVFAEFPSRE